MITAELFSQGPRPAAMSVAVLVNWSANFFVGIGFPTMQTTLENYTFLPFSVFLALFWVFTYKKVPETKNKTFDEIATLFRIGHKQRLLMNNVNSISQMNSVVCEHSSLMGHETKKGPMMGGGENGPDGDSKEYPLLPPNDSCPTSPRSRSPQSIRSNSQLSDYSNGHPERLMSPEDDEHSEDGSDNSERSLSTPPQHPGAPHPLEQSPHAVYLRPSPFEQCNSKSPPSHQHAASLGHSWRWLCRPKRPIHAPDTLAERPVFQLTFHALSSPVLIDIIKKEKEDDKQKMVVIKDEAWRVNGGTTLFSI